MPDLTPAESTAALVARYEDIAATASFAALEDAVEQGQEAALQALVALAAIRDRGLYKEAGFATFPDYCRERWGWGERMAYRKLAQARTARDTGEIPPQKRRSKALTRVSPATDASDSTTDAIAPLPEPRTKQDYDRIGALTRTAGPEPFIRTGMSAALAKQTAQVWLDVYHALKPKELPKPTPIAKARADLAAITERRTVEPRFKSKDAKR